MAASFTNDLMEALASVTIQQQKEVALSKKLKTSIYISHDAKLCFGVQASIRRAF